MFYRVVMLSTVLLAVLELAIPAYADDHKSWTLKGTCAKGNIAESDGVQTGANKPMNTSAYFALLKQAKAANLTLGQDGFLWSKQVLRCDSASILQMDDYKGHTMVTFSNGDLNHPILGFAGGRINGDGPLFFSSTIYLADGKAMPLNPGSGQGCHFYFTDHGTFTQGWETRITTIECNVRIKTADGHLVTGDVTFDVTQPPPLVQPSRDPTNYAPR